MQLTCCQISTFSEKLSIALKQRISQRWSDDWFRLRKDLCRYVIWQPARTHAIKLPCIRFCIEFTRLFKTLFYKKKTHNLIVNIATTSWDSQMPRKSMWTCVCWDFFHRERKEYINLRTSIFMWPNEVLK